MIAKIRTGAGFKGILGYAGDTDKKNAQIIAANGVATESLNTMCASFAIQAKSNPKVKKPVGHISLSFSKEDEDKLTPDFLHKIAVEYMHAMGIRNTQYVIFRHHDQPHPHIHIIYNRVDNDGKAIKGDTYFRKSTKICRTLTEKYGLTLGNGKDNVRRERLEGRDAARYIIHDAVMEAMKKCHNWQELITALAEKGIGMVFVSNDRGRVTGIVFSVNGITLSGRQVDRNMSIRKLDSLMSPEDRIYGRTAQNKQDSVSTSDTSIQDKDKVLDEKSHDSLAPFNNTDERKEAADTAYDNEKPSNEQSVASKVAIATLELLSPPQVHVSAGGGGGNKKTDDDKKKKRKKRR